MKLGKWVGWGLAAAGAAGAAAGTWWTVRAATADWYFGHETAEGARRAWGMEPGRAEYAVRLALLTGDEDPGGARRLLERAVELKPADAKMWIELGLRYEAEGEGGKAEGCLLRAAEESRRYLPRWTLANYYFRRGDTEGFWKWAREAAAMAYGDPLPLYRLCGKVEEDGRLIERLGIRKAAMRAGYLEYLAEQGRIDLAAGASRAVLEDGREEDVGLLLAACDRMLEAKRPEDAAAVWNGLADARRIPYGRAGEGKLVNGDFANAPGSHGFDWRLSGAQGIAAAREERGDGLRLTFSGAQPENCEALGEVAQAAEGTGYRLKWRYRTRGIAEGTGLGWQVTAAESGQVLGAGASLSSEQDTAGQLDFRTPRGCRMVRVALAYRRAEGTVRVEGYVVLRGVELARAD